MAFALTFSRGKQTAQQESTAFAAVAERLRRAGDLEGAVALCRDGLQRFPSYVSARVTLGTALLALGHHDDARAELERVVQLAPDNLLAIRGLAQLHGAGRGDDEAGSYRDAAAGSSHGGASSSEDDDYAHSMEALKNFAQGETVETVETVDAAPALAPIVGPLPEIAASMPPVQEAPQPPVASAVVTAVDEPVAVPMPTAGDPDLLAYESALPYPSTVAALPSAFPTPEPPAPEAVAPVMQQAAPSLAEDLLLGDDLLTVGMKPHVGAPIEIRIEDLLGNPEILLDFDAA